MFSQLVLIGHCFIREVISDYEHLLIPLHLGSNDLQNFVTDSFRILDMDCMAVLEPLQQEPGRPLLTVRVFFPGSLTAGEIAI